jgi:hypothetical protein
MTENRETAKGCRQSQLHDFRAIRNTDGLS